MKKFLALLLVLIMCTSLVLVSCDSDTKSKATETPTAETPTEKNPTEKPTESGNKNPSDEPADEPSANPLSAEEVITNYLSTITFEGLFDVDGLLAQSPVQMPEISVDEIVDQLKGIGKEMNVSVDNAPLGYVGMEDGIIKITGLSDDGSYGMVVIGDDGKISLVTVKSDGTYEVEEEIDILSQLSQVPAIGDLKEMIDEYIPEAAQKAIEGLKYPAVESGDLEYSDGYYYLTDAYFSKLFNETSNMAFEVLIAFDPDFEAVIEENRDELLETVTTALINTFELGFQIEDEEITGYDFTIFVNSEILSLLSMGEEIAEEDFTFIINLTTGTEGAQILANLTVDGVEVLDIVSTSTPIFEENRQGVKCEVIETINGEEISAICEAVMFTGPENISGVEISFSTDLSALDPSLEEITGAVARYYINPAEKTVNFEFKTEFNSESSPEEIEENGNTILVKGYGYTEWSAEMSISIDDIINSDSKLVEFNLLQTEVFNKFTKVDEDEFETPIELSRETVEAFNNLYGNNLGVNGDYVIGEDGKSTVTIYTEEGEGESFHIIRIDIGNVSDAFGEIPSFVDVLR